MHVKCGLMSSKVRLDIASHSISLITIDFYRVWIIQIFFLIQMFVTDIEISIKWTTLYRYCDGWVREG